MAHHYTLVLHSIARSVDAATLAAAMKSRAPINISDLTNLGVSVVSDIPSSPSPPDALRTVIFLSAGTGPLPDVPFSVGNPSPLGAYLQTLLTSQVEQAVSNPVRADPILEV